MSFVQHHSLVNRKFIPTQGAFGDRTFFFVEESGQFAVLNPGRIQHRVSAGFGLRFQVHRPKNQPDEFPLVEHRIQLQFAILTPDGREFNGTEVTLADLQKFRDLRGRPHGLWSYRLTGQSEQFTLSAPDNPIPTNVTGFVKIGLDETVRSESAAPLVKARITTFLPRPFSFDLFRVGTFVARMNSSSFTPWRGEMLLVDPDGAVMAQTRARTLRFPVTVAMVEKSRDSSGKVRKWTLRVLPEPGSTLKNGRVSATVIGSGRLSPATLQSRIERLIGPQGRFIELFGENKDGDAFCRLKITDPFAAETIDMYHLLERTLGSTDQGLADPKNIQPDTVYTLGRRSESLGVGLKLDVNALKVRTIDVSIGPGVMLGEAVPVVRLSVKVSGVAKIQTTVLSGTVATAKVRGGTLTMEVGIKLSPDGTPRIVIGMRDDPFDIDINIVLLASPILGAAAALTAEHIEYIFNKEIGDGARHLLSDSALAPNILMTFLGAHMDYLPPRFEGGDILFEHVAPLEPDPKPSTGYTGVIGRDIVQEGGGSTPHTPRPTIRPNRLGDTWASDNLAKVDHIVVVMMENRSYDHVLGYRARSRPGDGADGLTDALVAAIETGETHKIRNLQEAGFPANAIKLRTGIPKSPGHHLDDVAEQLAERTVGPGSREINSPNGFVENFLLKIDKDPQGVVGDDVLGYYDEKGLPFYAYLAENYAYCDRYFSSHPGPTLPNRMYSLTGDVQHDRYGVPILDNNTSDNFLLSREMTIYDLLTRKGVSWRVYESFPSVTMLRMFARYATNESDIVSIDRLQTDVAGGDLPAFTVIEPAMHHLPQDDDHPDADMYRGQIFIKRVYDALRSNPTLWEKTMLIITYDEHGGFYDHVIPPTADLLEDLTGAAGGEVVFEPYWTGSVQPMVMAFGGSLPGNLAQASDVFVMTPQPAATTWPPPTTLRVPYGVRVPTFVVSPWATPGKGPSVTLDHCSILKTVIARFASDKPFLSDRVHHSQNFDAFLTEAQPRMNVPAAPLLRSLTTAARSPAPGASEIATPPISRKAMREEPVEFHELTGRLARMLGR